jgi:hypothetical protein
MAEPPFSHACIPATYMAKGVPFTYAEPRLAGYSSLQARQYSDAG